MAIKHPAMVLKEADSIVAEKCANLVYFKFPFSILCSWFWLKHYRVWHQRAEDTKLHKTATLFAYRWMASNLL